MVLSCEGTDTLNILLVPVPLPRWASVGFIYDDDVKDNETFSHHFLIPFPVFLPSFSHTVSCNCCRSDIRSIHPGDDEMFGRIAKMCWPFFTVSTHPSTSWHLRSDVVFIFCPVPIRTTQPSNAASIVLAAALFQKCVDETFAIRPEGSLHGLAGRPRVPSIRRRRVYMSGTYQQLYIAGV